MEAVKAGEHCVVEVDARLGNGWEAFVEISVTMPKGCTATMDVSIDRYVLVLKISLPMLGSQSMMSRYPGPEPRYHTAELRMSSGSNRYYSRDVSGSDYVLVVLVVHSIGWLAMGASSSVFWSRLHVHPDGRPC